MFQASGVQPWGFFNFHLKQSKLINSMITILALQKLINRWSMMLTLVLVFIRVSIVSSAINKLLVSNMMNVLG